MALFLHCPSCGHRQTAKSKKCRACDRKIPNSALRYFIRVKDRKGIRHSQSLGICGRQYAEKQHSELLQAVNEGTRGQAPPTWNTVVNAYLKKLEIEASERYAYNPKTYLKRFSEYWGIDRSLEDISGAEIRVFLTGLRARGLSIYSANRHLAAGKAAWNYSVDDIPNPFSKVKAYNEREHQETPVPTDKELTAILSAASTESHEDYVILVTALETGLRRREVISLTRPQVNYDMRTISVIQKRGRPLTVALSERLCELLQELPPRSDDRFFSCTYGAWRYHWKRIKQRAGITRRFRFHELRHHFGAMFHDLTGDIRLTRDALGHSQIQTTMRYTRTNLERIREALNRRSTYEATED